MPESSGCEIGLAGGKWDLSVDAALAEDTGAWDLPSFNDKGYLIWACGRRAIWLGQTLTIPTDIEGYPLADSICRLGLIWWAEDAQIFCEWSISAGGGFV